MQPGENDSLFSSYFVESDIPVPMHKERSSNDKDIANHYGNFFQTEGRSKAVVRQQNIAFKAAVAKRPHFAHG